MDVKELEVNKTLPFGETTHANKVDKYIYMYINDCSQTHPC